MKRLVVCSLDLDAVEPLVTSLRSSFDVHTVPLQHDELRSGGAILPSMNAVLIVHYVEGRTLLLDEDGYYNRERRPRRLWM